jgi:elongation factor G
MERILFSPSSVQKIKEVYDGTTVSDWTEQENKRGRMLTSVATSWGWNTQDDPYANIKHGINWIDTPGRVDVTEQVEHLLCVPDVTIAVFCTLGSVQPQFDTVSRQTDQ